MSVAERPAYKAMYFDLKIEKLAEHFSLTNPKGGYKRIHEFLEKHEFSHEQYSGYHSNEQLTDLKVMDLVDEMKSELPWLGCCIRKFEITNIDENYDISALFPEVNI